MTRKFLMRLNRLDEEDSDITVEYTLLPGAPDTYDASRGGPGGWDPGYGPEVEIHRAFTATESNVKLTDDEEKTFREIILENHDDE